MPAVSFAMPTVSGNTVTWPDDGWYQVQQSETFDTVCEGRVSAVSSATGGPCIIGSDTYIVINHTSGERFTNITAIEDPANGVQVEGDTISWPDDGWYQVQNSTDFVSICEGGRSCTVEPGNYIVINHTTGERFVDIVVSGGGMSENGVVVDGDTISWPDDGWYQVQNSVDFTSICEGGTSCMVEPGNYIVINHTTGERFVDIEVSGGGMSENGVVVDGDTISWPDDGWYQVQNSDDFTSICEGGASCMVEPGNYIVINHTTGQRFTDIEVGSGSGSDVFQLGDATPDLLLELVAHSSDQLAPLVDILAYEAIDSASDAGEPLADGEFTTEDSRFGTVVTSIQRTSYNCAAGGTLIREIGRMRLDDISYTHIRDIDAYEFDQCRIVNEQSPLASGDYIASGRLEIEARFRSGSRFGESESNFVWNQFDLQGPEGDGYELEGSSSTSSISGAFTDAVSNRAASFDYYRKSEGDVVVESVTDGSFTQRTVAQQAGQFKSIEIEFAGTVAGTATAGNDVLIVTDAPLMHTASTVAPEVYQAFTGQLSLTSSDGSFLTLVADPSGNDFDPLQNLFMDWSGELADGEVISRSDVLLDEYTFSAPNCGYSRASDDVSYACTEEGEQLLVP